MGFRACGFRQTSRLIHQRRMALLSLWFVAMASLAWSQTQAINGSIRGRVTDATGAPVARIQPLDAQGKPSPSGKIGFAGYGPMASTATVVITI